MTSLHVRSSDGDNADDGSTWALAKATLSGAAAIDAAGDVIYVADDHYETAVGFTAAFAGTLASPVQILCVDDTSDPAPPTALAITGIIESTGAGAVTISGTIYCYGIIFKAGVSGVSSSASFLLSNVSNDWQRYRKCEFWLQNTTSGTPKIIIGSPTSVNNQMSVVWEDCNVKFNLAGHGISMYRGNFKWRGGSVLSGSVAITQLFAPAANCPFDVEIDGVDFANLGAATNFFQPETNSRGRGVIRNCTLPTSWTGALAGTIAGFGCRFEMHNCDNADTNYRLWVEDYSGSIKSETTIIRTGGANDGTTGLSWKMATSANAEFPAITLASPEIVQWNETTGSSITATVEIVHDSQGAGSGSKFQDDEVWLEVQYLGTSGFPVTTYINDAKLILATAANQADSSETWTTTGLTTPVKQKLSVTFTPQEKGFVHARVVMAKASKVCYVCPKLTVA